MRAINLVLRFVPLTSIAVGIGLLLIVGCSSTAKNKSNLTSNSLNTEVQRPPSTPIPEDVKLLLRRLEPPLPPQFEDRRTWVD